MKNQITKILLGLFLISFVFACSKSASEVSPDSLSAGAAGTGKLTIDGASVDCNAFYCNASKYGTGNTLLTLQGTSAGLSGAKSVQMQIVVAGTIGKAGIYNFSTIKTGLNPGSGYGAYTDASLTGTINALYSLESGTIEITTFSTTEAKGKINLSANQLDQKTEKLTGKIIKITGAFAAKVF
jgi:hypothetical protein